MSEFRFSLPSFAKINLGLEVIGRRDDGFHEIFTIFQTVSLCDRLDFSAAKKLTLTCSDASVPDDARNLVIRAAEALAARFNVHLGAAIHLEKRIPSPGGLGGGSSNAAVALIGLTRLWNLGVMHEDLSDIGSELGSDVPFFFRGGTAAAKGRGTEISDFPEFDAPFLVIVTPNIAVSTVAAFEGLNAANLTSTDANRILEICRLREKSQDLLSEATRNDFESTVFAAYPEVGSAKNALLDFGASFALLSGSGASVFGIFDTEETRQTAIKALDAYVNWRKFAVATISRNAYREALGLV